MRRERNARGTRKNIKSTRKTSSLSFFCASCVLCCASCVPFPILESDLRCLLDNRKLGRLDVERLPFAGAALRVFRCYGVAHNAGGCIIGPNPLEHPELAFRLLCRLTGAHRKIHGLAAV